MSTSEGREMKAEVEEVLTIAEAAERMKMSVRHVRRLVADRRIAFHKLGRSVRVLAVDVQAYIDAGRVEPINDADVWRGLRGRRAA